MNIKTSKKNFLKVGLALFGFISLAAEAKQPMVGVFKWDKPSLTDSFSEFAGVPVDIGQSHQPKENWSKIEWEGWQYLPWAKWVKAKPGRILNLSVAPFPAYGQGSLEGCARGDYNFHYKILANRLVANGFEGAILRFGWEFSGNWMPWYPTSGKAYLFRDCFRQFVNTVRTAEPNGKMRFDYNPNYDVSQAVLEGAYPGDEYVDFIGLDLYDQSWNGSYAKCPASGCDTTAAMNNWNTTQLPNLKKFVKFATLHKKPLSIPEWGTVDLATNGGGDNPTFIKNMLTFIQDPANRVAYQVYFDVKAPDGDHQLMEPTEFPRSAALYQQMTQAGGEQTLEVAEYPTGTATATSTATSTTTSTSTATAVFTAPKVQVNPSSAYVGGTFSAVSTITASANDSAIIQLSFKDAVTAAVVETKQFALRAFSAGRAENFSALFNAPANLKPGSYRVDLVAYSADYKKTYLYKNDSIFSLLAPVYDVTTANLSAVSIVAGSKVDLSADLSSSIAEKLVLEFAIADSAGSTLLKQQVNVDVAAGVRKSASITIDIPASFVPGAYNVLTTVRSADLSKVRAQSGAATLNVTPIYSASAAVVNPGTVQVGAPFKVASLISTSGNESLSVGFVMKDTSTSAIIAQHLVPATEFVANEARLISADLKVPMHTEPGLIEVETIVYGGGSSEIKLSNRDAQFTIVPAVYKASSAILSPSSLIAGGKVLANSEIEASVDDELAVTFTLVDPNGEIIDTQNLAPRGYSAGVAHSESVSFDIPSTSLAGNYRVDVIAKTADQLRVRAQSSAALTVKPVVYAASKMVVNPAAVKRGTAYSLSANLISPSTETMIVQFVIIDSAGKVVEMIRLSNVAFTANIAQTLSKTTTMSVSAPVGKYRVETYLYTPDFKSTKIYRNDGSFTVE